MYWVQEIYCLVEYVDMTIKTEAYIIANKRLPAIRYSMLTLPDYKDSIMNLFRKIFV